MSTKQKFIYLPKVHHKIMIFLVVLYFLWEGFAGVFNSINLTRFFMENPTGDYATTTIVINAIGIPMGGLMFACGCTIIWLIYLGYQRAYDDQGIYWRSFFGKDKTMAWADINFARKKQKIVTLKTPSTKVSIGIFDNYDLQYIQEHLQPYGVEIEH